MWYLHLDESGDLGFDFVNKKPSRFFTICLLATSDVASYYAIRKAIKKTLGQLKGRINPTIPLHIDHQVSHREPALQAADLFAWGIFRKYEKSDSKWFDVYREKIRFDELYLGQMKRSAPPRFVVPRL